MLHCTICKKTYKSAVQYNIHLQRNSHWIKERKYEIVYGKDKKSETYAKWIMVKDHCNEKRDETKK